MNYCRPPPNKISTKKFTWIHSASGKRKRKQIKRFLLRYSSRRNLGLVELVRHSAVGIRGSNIRYRNSAVYWLLDIVANEWGTRLFRVIVDHWKCTEAKWDLMHSPSACVSKRITQWNGLCVFAGFWFFFPISAAFSALRNRSAVEYYVWDDTHFAESDARKRIWIISPHSHCWLHLTAARGLRSSSSAIMFDAQEENNNHKL